MSRGTGNTINAFFNNLFGTIAGPSALGRFPITQDFIPTDGSGGTLKLRGENASWLGLQMPLQQKYAYEFCYPVSSVVDRLAEADIAGNREILRARGKGKEDYATSDFAVRWNKLLDQPNPLQTYEQFRGQQIVYKKIFGFCPVLPVYAAGFPDVPTSLVNIPPWLFTAIPTYKYLYQNSIEQMVDYYRVTLLGNTFTLKPNEVLILKDSFWQDDNQGLLLPKSRLVGLDMAVSNICAAMEADNVLLRKKGPLGFISHDAAATKDSVAGYLPMTPKEKIEIQDDFLKYGMSWSQYQYLISRQALRWNAMSFDVKGLGTKETILASSKAVCQRYGFPYVLFEDSDATYSNQENAHKKLYDNNVIPNNRRDFNEYMRYFKFVENQCKLVTDYGELSVFQKDALNEGLARKAADEGYEIEYLNDMITRNEWRTYLGLDSLPDGDLYYSESAAKKAEDQANADKAASIAKNAIPNA